MKKLAQLGWSFFWITSVTLGGGMAMLPLLDREFVERRGWMTSQEMLDVVAVMQSLPGIIALNMSVLIGYRLKGVAGAAVAVVASSVTPFAVIAAIAGVMSGLSASPVLDHVFLAVRAGTAALVLLSLVKLAKGALGGVFAWCVAVVSFVATVILRIDVTLVILCGLATGVVLLAVETLRRVRK